MKILRSTAALLLMLLFAREGFAVSDIASIQIGVVWSIETLPNSYWVTLDDGSAAQIPLNNPVRPYFLHKEVLFPHFGNDCIALVKYNDGTSDWLPARAAVSIAGNEVVMGRSRRTFKDVTFEQFVRTAQQLGDDYLLHAYAGIGVNPVPSMYTILLDAQFAEHNFDVIKDVVTSADKELLVDMAYIPSRKTPFELIYVQKTRFSKNYCEQMGIQTTN